MLKLQDQFVALWSNSLTVQLLNTRIVNNSCCVIGIDGCNDKFYFWVVKNVSKILQTCFSDEKKGRSLLHDLPSNAK